MVLVTMFSVLQHDHEMVVPGISLRKPSVHDSDSTRRRPLESATNVAILSNIMEIGIFRYTGDSLGETYRRSEGLARKLRLEARLIG